MAPATTARYSRNATRQARLGPTDSVHRFLLSRVHWVRPELVVEVKYLTWTDDNLLRQVVYEGLRESGRGSASRAHSCKSCGIASRPPAVDGYGPVATLT